MPRGEPKSARLADWIAEHRPVQIGEQELAAIRTALSPVSETHLRKLVRASGVSLDALVEGVVQDDFAALERTLCALSSEYDAADRNRARAARQCVLTGKEHTSWALKRRSEDAGAAAAKREMLLWMQTWLENPGLFAEWVTLRKRLLNVD